MDADGDGNAVCRKGEQTPLRIVWRGRERSPGEAWADQEAAGHDTAAQVKNLRREERRALMAVRTRGCACVAHTCRLLPRGVVEWASAGV